MSAATEREEIVQKLEGIFTGTERFEAVRGEDVKEKYAAYQHPVPGQPVTLGIIGCTESHRQIFTNELSKADSEFVGVFEDDCVFTLKKEELEKWITTSVPDDWDILFLGTTEHVRAKSVNEETMRIYRFWGAHAFILRSSVLPKILESFDKKREGNPLMIPDWWLSFAIKDWNLVAYAPKVPTRFCHQKEGLVSYLTGKPRTYRLVP